MKQIHLMTEEHTWLPVTDVFNGLSKDELVAALSIMHRILGADKRRDLEQLVAELPRLLIHRTGTQNIHQKESLLEAASSKGERTYRLLHYVSSCLSKAQTKMNTTRAGRVHIDKHQCHLSPREIIVLLWMKEGKTNWEIAKILGLSERTVRFHVGRIFEKLDVTSRTQAVARALGIGLIAS